VALVAALARACDGLPGLARTALVASLGGLAGALVGRFAADTVLDLAGGGVVAATMAGLLGGAVALGAVGGAVAIGDRRVIQGWRGTSA